ncbi:MAG: hypothetical protein GXP56_15165 [Deltaproteobacteria bacterium]|nr:hypothetical protein [Deltaproteobacteria bacterium]
MANHKFLSGLFNIAVVLLVLSSCTPIRPATNPLLDKKAFILASRARSLNQHIISSKGAGIARLQTKTRIDKFRLAWAAVFPDKIRITFLVYGQPMETIISTGKKITFVSHTGKHSKYSYNSKNPDLKEYIHVPLKISEIISILLGRLPVKKYNDAYFSPSDSSQSTIILTQSNKRGKQYLHFNAKKQIDGLKYSDSMGKYLYGMTVKKYKTYSFGNIPVKIEIKDKGNRKLTLEITNFQLNPVIKDSVFRLTDQG